MCNKMLDSTTVAEHDKEVYCKQCHGRKFGIKGYGFGGGSGALNMDKGEKFGGRDGGESRLLILHWKSPTQCYHKFYLEQVARPTSYYRICSLIMTFDKVYLK
ncbi:unnamed protein product [Protopolystoma xenopodis]|uniref:LIM zinc-binding domain-containing protein n=1 Tax=Protopolystoma xenopodis TaxID=117903 RepID=A0A448XFE3_9PLAT|nr:unnamed protein product [Protopolystoma xenopodis]